MRHICAFILAISFFCGITSITMAKSKNAAKLIGNEINFKTKILENKTGKRRAAPPPLKLIKTNHSITKKQSAERPSVKNKRKQRVLQMIERAIQKASEGSS